MPSRASSSRWVPRSTMRPPSITSTWSASRMVLSRCAITKLVRPRIKLASELQRNARGHGLYILDEPTTSLHPADIELLITQLQQLVDNHNSVIIVEHQLEAIANADWMLDLGPGGGDAGGQVVAEGPPLALAGKRALIEKSRTLQYLAKTLRET